MVEGRDLDRENPPPMSSGAPNHGFQQFLQTPHAREAEPWQLDLLASWEWPEGVEASAETYRLLKEALDTASNRRV